MTRVITLFVLLTSAVCLADTLSGTASAKPVACTFFEDKNAEKLFGQKASGIDSHEINDDGSQRWACTFTAPGTETKIYFLLTKDVKEDAAKEEFDKVRLSNKDHSGFEEWPGVADEAVAHTDGRNFQFVMLRKGVRTIRVKINRSASVSFNDVKAIAELLAAKLS